MAGVLPSTRTMGGGVDWGGGRGGLLLSIARAGRHDMGHWRPSLSVGLSVSVSPSLPLSPSLALSLGPLCWSPLAGNDANMPICQYTSITYMTLGLHRARTGNAPRPRLAPSPPPPGVLPAMRGGVRPSSFVHHPDARAHAHTQPASAALC